MKIKSLQLKNFKRFTDLTLQDIPDNAKLVLLIGSNGSGKSSVFDAFELLNERRFRSEQHNSYYNKNNNKFEIIVDFGFDKIDSTQSQIMQGPGPHKILINSYYGRTSFRQIPRLTRTSLGNNFDIGADNDRPRSFIDRDNRFENDLEYLFGRLLKEFFKTNDDKSEIKEAVINPINESLEKIFPKENGIQLVELIPPLEGKIADVNFKKGNSIFHYNQLSAGEKEVFNILINLIARKQLISDIVYFDEIDLHLNTKLQYSLLKEIVRILPDTCQFWTASHSLGFIQYAKESEQAVIIDLDDLDFDLPRIISPEPKDNASVYDIAISQEILPELFKDFDIIFVEGEDKKYYASLNIERTLFVPEKNRDGVFHKSKAGQFKGLVDRDFLTDDDIVLIKENYPLLRILDFYCVENYLFHPDNLLEYHLSNRTAFNKEEYIQKIFEQKEIVKAELLIKVASIRQGYPYFKEVGLEKHEGRKRFMPENSNYEQSKMIAGYLNSANFDDYYKSFSMKDNCKSLAERQNINPIDLSKTNWFKIQIEQLIK